MDIFGILYPVRENNAVSLALDFISPRSNKIYGVAVRCYYNHCNGYFSVDEKKSQPFCGWRNVDNLLTVDISSKQVDTSTVAVDISINKVATICTMMLLITAMMFSVHKKRYRLRYENPRVTVGAKLASESVSGGFSSLNAFVYKRCHSS